MGSIESIAVSDTPPKGHYSPGVRHGGLVYVSGQLPFGPDDESRELGTVAEQTEIALRNVERVLRNLVGVLVRYNNVLNEDNEGRRGPLNSLKGKENGKNPAAGCLRA